MKSTGMYANVLNMKNEDTKQKIEKLYFRSGEYIDIASAMYTVYYPDTGNRKDLCSSLFRILAYLVMTDICVRSSGKPTICFVYSNSYKNRQDYYDAFHSLTELFEDRVVVEPGKKKLCLKQLRYTPSVISWYKQFRKAFSFQEAVYYTSMLLFGMANSDYICHVVRRLECRKIVVISDMHLIDSLLVQKCNRMQLTTFTLQHGNFETEVPFKLSKSKYFLAYGEYTKRKAVSFGVAPGRIIKTGVFRSLNTVLPASMEKCGTPQNMGIILSGYGERDGDIRMLQFFIEYGKKHGMKLLVKCHPHYGVDRYPEIDWTQIDEVYSEEISATDFKKMIDVGIVYTSTVFVEYVMGLFPALIFVPENNAFFDGIEWCKFRNSEELETLLHKLEWDSSEFEKNLKQTRAFFSESENAAQTYFRVITETE